MARKSTFDLEDHTPEIPDIQELQAYRGIYALCTVGANKRLRATHYASVLLGGKAPLWGIWLNSGKFLRFAASRSQIEDAYPNLVWRRRMATWTATDLAHKPMDTRRRELEGHYGRLPKRTTS